MDTTDTARRIQLAIFAKMSGEEKVLMAGEMADQCRAITLEGIRARNPELSEREVHHEWLRILHGDLAEKLIAIETAHE